MKLQFIFYIFIAAFICSCGTTHYMVATSGNSGAQYILVGMQDSALVILPEELQFEITPEIIREYGKRVSFDSLTVLTKKTTASVGLGVLAGMAICGIGGYQAYSEHSKTFGNSVQTAMIGTLIGIIPGAIFATAANSEKKMLPVHDHLRELQSDIKNIER